MHRINYESLVGSTRGYWQILSIKKEKRKKSLFLCNCICGVQKYVSCADLIKGKTNSCGCKKKELSRTSSLERYGCENPLQNEDVRAKIKTTCLSKYGTDCSLQATDIKNKAEKTLIEKYGADNVFKNKEMQRIAKERSASTISAKYGVAYPFLSDQIRDTAHSVLIDKYGSISPFIDEKVRNRARANMQLTNIAKYGVPEYFQSEEFRQLAARSNWYTSKGEEEIKEFVRSLGYDTIKKKGKYEIDVFISSKNIGIEHNGLYWHSELNVNQNYHLNKMKMAANEKIRLIQIFEHEWLRRKSQVKSYLRSALGKNYIKVYARKCSIEIVDKETASAFLDKYHIQGRASFINAFGLVNNGELLALLTVNYHHRDSRKMTVNRFVSKEGVTVTGGLSRLTKFASNYIKKDLISWCDLRLSEGSGYRNAGWEQEEILRPDYFYTKGLRVFSKQSRRKSVVNTPSNMTEREHALQDGLVRVWDCGKIRFIYKYQDNSLQSLPNKNY